MYETAFTLVNGVVTINPALGARQALQNNAVAHKGETFADTIKGKHVSCKSTRNGLQWRVDGRIVSASAVPALLLRA